MNDWHFFILAWLISIPTGIIINLISPSIGIYLKNRSLSAKERKIKTLLIHYINIKNQREHRIITVRSGVLFGIPVFMWLPLVSGGLIILVLELIPNFGWFRDVLMIIAYIPMYYSSIWLFESLADLRDLSQFDSFKSRTINKLKKLGRNPKDYGIE